MLCVTREAVMMRVCDLRRDLAVKIRRTAVDVFGESVDELLPSLLRVSALKSERRELSFFELFAYE